VDRLDRFRQKRRYTQYLDLIKLTRVITQRYRVRHDDLFNIRVRQELNGVTGKNRVRETRMNSFGARIF
jgi:hypothetical protein